MSGNRESYNRKREDQRNEPVAHHETAYEVRKKEEAHKDAVCAEKKKSRKGKMEALDREKRPVKKQSDTTGRVTAEKAAGSKAGEKKKHGKQRFLPGVIGLAACIMLIVGIVMVVSPLSGSRATAQEMDPISVLPTTTNVYDEGLVAIGAVTQEELDKTAALGASAKIPPKAKEYDPIIYSYAPAGNRVALTFDDGPSTKDTEKYLQILADNNVKASFFMLGNSVQAYPDLAKKVDDAGHDVVSHSLEHAVLSKLDTASLQADFEKTNAIFKEALGHTPKYMRPPYGSYNDETLSTARNYGQIPIYWSIDTNDWRGNSTETMVNTITSNLSAGAIILMHEGKANTLAALPTIIQAVRDAGYEFVPLSELLSY